MTQPANKRFVMEDKLTTELALKAPIDSPSFTGAVNAGVLNAGDVSASSVTSSGSITSTTGNLNASAGDVNALRLRATSTSGSGTADAAIITGTPSGAHLGIGVAGIVAMSDATTYTTLNLQPAGGNISVGDSTTTMTVNGELVARGYRLVSRIEHTSSPAPFVKADYPWLRAIRVICVGGGGGGGGAALTAAAQNAIGQAGCGAYTAETFITDIASLAASETLTVGVGGNAGGAGAAGGVGGNTSFGTLCVGRGGNAGGAGAASALNSFVTGPSSFATGSVGDIIYPGSSSGPRHYAYAASVVKPLPGGSVVSPGPTTAQGITSTSSAGGVPGTAVFGVGGYPGVNAQSQAAAVAGGAGSSGLMIVELYA